MALVALVLFVLGVAAFSYGLGLVYWPLLPISLGGFALGLAYILSRPRVLR